MKPYILLIVFIFLHFNLHAAENEPSEFAINHFRSEETEVKIWHYSWISIYASSAAWYGYKAESDHRLRVTNSVITAKSILAIVPFITTPYPGINGDKKIMEHQDNESSESYRISEQLLRDSSEHVQRNNSGMARVISFLTNLAGAGVIFFFEKEEPLKNALMGMATGMAVGEIQIWTQPAGSVAGYREFQNKFSSRNTMNWFIQSQGMNISMGIYF